MKQTRRDFLRAVGLGGAALASMAPGRPSEPVPIAPVPVQEITLVVDASTLNKKVLCGYQGWFRCPGDAANVGWRHWSRSSTRIAPDTLTFEMWPDLSEYGHDEKYLAPGFTYPDGEQAYLFSSAHPRTVLRHFEWMLGHGIDGVLVQRFLVEVADPPNASLVLQHARDAANQTGRVFAVEYDMSGMPTAGLLARMTNDWRYLVDHLRITSDHRYLHHNGQPVLAVWGFFRDRFDAQLANQIIDYFKGQGVFLIGGCQWWWRTETDVEWGKAFRRFDVISPWNVGNYTTRNGTKYASTGSWQADMREAARVGMDYLPVLYPGFSWDNLQRLPPGTSLIPRLGGAFLWDQFTTAKSLGVTMAKVAMFDEVDEGTAIFKVTNSPPTQGYFVTYDGMASDSYLSLTGQGTRLLRG